MKAERLINVDDLIARIVRLSGGRMTAEWSTLGIVKVIEESYAAANVSNVSLKDTESDL